MPYSAVGRTLTHATPAPLISRSLLLFPRFPGSSKTGIPFWPSSHALRGTASRTHGVSAAWPTFQIFGRGENMPSRGVFSDFADMPLGRALCLRRALWAH